MKGDAMIQITIGDDGGGSKQVMPRSTSFHRKSLSGGASSDRVSSKDSHDDSLKGEDLSRLLGGDKNVDLFSYSRYIWADKEGRHLMMFTSLRIIFMFIAMYFGFATNSLALISISFHMCFDSLAMGITLFAFVLGKRKPTFAFSYGYDRFELLCGFSNSVFLLFVSLFIFFESFERCLDTEDIDSAPVMTVSVVGFIVNLIGILFFHKHAQMRSERKEQPLRLSIFHRIITDNVSIILLLVSSWLVQWGFLLADPLVAVTVSCLVLYTAVPLAKDTGRVLLQTTPVSVKDEIFQRLREISTFDGVLEVKNEHFWTQSPGVFVGSLIVRVKEDVDSQRMLTSINNKLNSLITHLTVQIEKVHQEQHWTSTPSSSSSSSSLDPNPNPLTVSSSLAVPTPLPGVLPVSAMPSYSSRLPYPSTFTPTSFPSSSHHTMNTT